MRDGEREGVGRCEGCGCGCELGRKGQVMRALDGLHGLYKDVTLESSSHFGSKLPSMRPRSGVAVIVVAVLHVLSSAEAGAPVWRSDHGGQSGSPNMFGNLRQKLSDHLW